MTSLCTAFKFTSGRPQRGLVPEILIDVADLCRSGHEPVLAIMIARDCTRLETGLQKPEFQHMTVSIAGLQNWEHPCPARTWNPPKRPSKDNCPLTGGHMGVCRKGGLSRSAPQVLCYIPRETPACYIPLVAQPSCLPQDKNIWVCRENLPLLHTHVTGYVTGVGHGPCYKPIVLARAHMGLVWRLQRSGTCSDGA